MSATGLPEKRYLKRGGITPARLSFKLGDPGSILGRTSTRAIKVLKELRSKCYRYIDISKWLDFRVFSDKDVKIVDISDPLS